MEYISRRVALWAIASVFLASTQGCDRLPETFKSQANKYLSDGSALVSVTEGRITYMETRQLYTLARGSYGLLKATWPEGKLEKEKAAFERALKAWEWALRLWQYQIGRADQPTEPDINSYDELIAFAGDRLIVEVFSKNYLVPAYRGKKNIPYKNIGVLLKIGNDSFNEGRTGMLKYM